MGIGYEVLMLAGKHDNLFTRVISAPGLWVQRLTTKEPTLDMLEVAITSIKCALRDEYPEYMEFFLNREWEPKPENTSEGCEDDGTADGESENRDTASSVASEGAFDLPEIGIDGPTVDVAKAPTVTASVADTDADAKTDKDSADGTNGDKADGTDDTDENDA